MSKNVQYLLLMVSFNWKIIKQCINNYETLLLPPILFAGLLLLGISNGALPESQYMH